MSAPANGRDRILLGQPAGEGRSDGLRPGCGTIGFSMRRPMPTRTVSVHGYQGELHPDGVAAGVIATGPGATRMLVARP